MWSSNHCAWSAMILDLRGLVLVHVEHQRFPRSLDAARVEIDLDEAVDGVDRRGAVLDPGDVVRLAVALFASAVERHQRAQRRWPSAAVAYGIAASR